MRWCSLNLFLFLVRFVWLSSCSRSALQCGALNSTLASLLSIGYLSFPTRHPSSIAPPLSTTGLSSPSAYALGRLKSASCKNFSCTNHLSRVLTGVAKFSLPVLQLNSLHPCFCLGPAQSLTTVSSNSVIQYYRHPTFIQAFIQVLSQKY